MTLNQEVPSFNLAMAIWEKFACAVGQGTLPKVALYNYHLLYLDTEHGMLKDMIAALKLEDLIYMKLSRTKSIKF